MTIYMSVNMSVNNQYLIGGLVLLVVVWFFFMREPLNTNTFPGNPGECIITQFSKTSMCNDKNYPARGGSTSNGKLICCNQPQLNCKSYTDPCPSDYPVVYNNFNGQLVKGHTGKGQPVTCCKK
jgi:hypothetical protein